MKRTVIAGMLTLVTMLPGCAATEKHGDARLVTKRNMMKAVTYSLNSPEFGIGEKKEYLFEYRDLPFPALPSTLIVVRHQWPDPDKGKDVPSFADTRYQITFEDPDGTVFLSTTVTLSATMVDGTREYGRVARLYEPGGNPRPRQTYTVRVSVIKPSSRKKDKAYLHSFSIGKDHLY